MSRNHTGRLAKLERQLSSELSGKQQLELYRDAVYGDRTAISKFEALHAAGKLIPLLWALYLCEAYGPCYGAGRCTTCATHRIPAAPRKETASQ